jgi:hypothetical protein
MEKVSIGIRTYIIINPVRKPNTVTIRLWSLLIESSRMTVCVATAFSYLLKFHISNKS